MLVPLKASTAFESFASKAIGDMTRTFKDATWTQTSQATSDGVTVKLREGKFTHENGVLMEMTVAQFISGNRRLGVVTLQRAGDKVASDLADKVVGTVVFR